MKVLITRPIAAAERLAKRVAGLGYQPVLAPLLEIVPHADPAGIPADATALLFTSTNGVCSYSRQYADRMLPVLAVGPATEAAARAEGFSDVSSADGNASALASLLRRRPASQSGHLVHVRGTHVVGEPMAALRMEGFRISERILYSANPVGRLPEAAHRVIGNGELVAALFYSSRTVEAFEATLTRELRAGLGRSHAIAIAPRVARSLAQTGFRTVRTAARPRQGDMMACLVELEVPGKRFFTDAEVLGDAP